MEDPENKPRFVRFKIEKTEMITVKRRVELEDLSCSKVAQQYLLDGFQIIFSDFELSQNIEGTSFSVSIPH